MLFFLRTQNPDILVLKFFIFIFSELFLYLPMSDKGRTVNDFDDERPLLTWVPNYA